MIEVASCTVAELFSGIIPELGKFEELEYPDGAKEYAFAK
jgi:hypothetical protein